MARIIQASIDVTKIDKKKLITGKKGTYLNIQISVNDEPNEYDQDCSISIGQSKEERESKEPKVYIGNGKTVWKSEATPSPAPVKDNSEDDGLPF